MTGRPGDLSLDGRGLPLPVVVVDADGVVVAADPGARRWAPEGAAEGPFEAWFDERDAVTVQAALAGVHGHPPVARLRGTERWVALHARPDGPEVVVVLRDATDEQFVRAAVDVVADSTFVLDAQGGNRWRSARLRERSGVPDEVAAQHRAGARIHPEDLPVVFETFTSVGEERPATVMARSRAVDDDDRWETIQITVWNRNQHEVLAGLLVQVHNLDEGRTLKTALSEADPELLSLTEAAPVGIAVTDPAGQVVYCNPLARWLLGRELQTFGDADWLAAARPEDRATLTDALRSALTGGLSSEVIALFDAGSTGARWLRLRFVPQVAADPARTKGVIATVDDVTAQLDAQARLAEAEEQMRHLATHDTLTGLPNRAALTEELDRALARHARLGSGLAVLFCDLDGFKPVNDSWGHAGGDEVLAEVARRLRAAVRDVDFVARFGGDEFVVVCEGTGADSAVVEQVCQRLHDLVEQPIEHREGVEQVGVSIGGALLAPGAVADGDQLLLLSDQAMYEAKATGRGGTVLRSANADG